MATRRGRQTLSKSLAASAAAQAAGMVGWPKEGPLEKCRLIDLPLHSDARGTLVFMESSAHVPFEIQRVFSMVSVPAGATRADHANRHLQEVLIALSGSFRVILRSPDRRREFVLDTPGRGLYVHPLTWLTLSEFSIGAVALVLASQPFAADDHVNDFGEFCRLYRHAGDQP